MFALCNEVILPGNNYDPTYINLPVLRIITMECGVMGRKRTGRNWWKLHLIWGCSLKRTLPPKLQPPSPLDKTPPQNSKIVYSFMYLILIQEIYWISKLQNKIHWGIEWNNVVLTNVTVLSNAMILSSMCNRTIQEVKQERDSMAFQNIQPFQPPFHHQAPANTPVSRPMPTRRDGNSRQTESLYDPPMQLPPKMWRGAASTQNLSLEDTPPSPCETGRQQQGMLRCQSIFRYLLKYIKMFIFPFTFHSF